MNKQRYRLVFSKHLGMLVPVSEGVRSQLKQGGSGRAARRLIAAILALTAIPALADRPAGLQPHATRAWTNAAIDAARTNATQMTIRQNAAKAILNWQKLNLDSGQVLNFDQQGNRNWSALNRIFDADPSRILGTVNASGHIYFVNQNGIIFGNGAQINVGSLTATSLDDVSNDKILDRFNAGLLSDPATAAFSGLGGFVRVDPGATITTATGGRVMLLAPNVENGGLIHTPEGQTILAAGQKVYLLDSADPAGLLVEVDSGGSATNLGEIISERGNTTLVGLAVNQQGRISATTSVRANGSIHLLARDSVRVDQANGEVVGLTPKRYGKVSLGAGSATTVTAELSDKEEVLDAQPFTPSRVRIEGRNIAIDGKIEAKGGEVAIQAPVNDISAPAHTDPAFQNLANRVYLGDNASIDVSGVDATAPMSRHQLEIQLFSEQLKDAPLQRGGPLFGETIYVDARKGTPLVDIEPFKALKGKTVAEKLSAGGKVNITASDLSTDPGDIVVRSGATIDVSGGSVTYESGLIRESSLRHNNILVPISKARPDVAYQGTGETYSKTYRIKGRGEVPVTWYLSSSPAGTIQSGYVEGADAGDLSIRASKAALEGTFRADFSAGSRQRLDPPAGGTFQLSLVSPIRLLADSWKLPLGFGPGDAMPASHISESQLDIGLLDNGFTHFEVAGSRVIVDSPLHVDHGGTYTKAIDNPATPEVETAGLVIRDNVTLKGDVEINADVRVYGGDLRINTDAFGNTNDGAVTIADGVGISTSGLWTNDSVGLPGALTSQPVQDGGNISIYGVVTGTNALSLGGNAWIDASAGAWLMADGDIKGGKSGNISLSGIIDIDPGQVAAFGFSKGGSLTLNTLQDVQIGGALPASGLYLSPTFFRGGFSAYSISAGAVNADLTVGDAGSNTRIHPEMLRLQYSENDLATVLSRDGGRSLRALLAERGDRAGISTFAELIAQTQPVNASLTPVPASISLAAGNDLMIHAGSTIETGAPASANGARGNISLSAGGGLQGGQLTIEGDLIAPGAAITAKVAGGTALSNYDNTLSLFVGAGSSLDASGGHIEAGRYRALDGGPDVIDAYVFDAGSISLDGGERAVVVTKAGSVLDVSGKSGAVQIVNSEGDVQSVTQFGAAGSINISSRNGLALDGEMQAGAQGSGKGGTLNITLGGNQESKIGNDHPNGRRILSVTQQQVNRAGGLVPGQALTAIVDAGGTPADPEDDVGTGAISSEQIADAGFDRVNLKVDIGSQNDRLLLPSGLDLQVPTALKLDAGTLEVTGNGIAKVASSHVTLSSVTSGAAPSSGNNTLQVDADFIDLVDDVRVSGVNTTRLNSRTGIRGRDSAALQTGSLVVPGRLELNAREIYPSTNTRFRFEATGAGSEIAVQGIGQASGKVLSAAGQLTLKAEDITQGGTLVAPLGQITLDAVNRLTLEGDSLTSVSAAGQLIPFGVTRLGGLDLATPTSDLVPGLSPTLVTESPNKKVVLEGDAVDLQAGARVDISGGGDILAYEWIEGIGGSKDFLAQPGVYAVLPTLKGEFAPYDYNYFRSLDAAGNVVNSDVQPGDAVSLTGVPGLESGTYTLLPGRYALLPGAFVVQASTADVRRGDSLRQDDGSYLVSGYKMTLDGRSRDTRDGSFRILSGDVFRSAYGTKDFRGPAEYLLTTGDAFLRDLSDRTGNALGRLTADAGQAVFSATTRLDFDGNLLTNHVSGSRGALVDVVSDKISVVSAVGADNGTLQLAADTLNRLGVDSLLLGGTRSQSGGSMTVTTQASRVTFANDAAHSLSVNELVATATDMVKLDAGASVRSVEGNGNSGQLALNASGDGALLAVSALNDITYQRTGFSATPAAGTLDIDAGADLGAAQSLVLDATKLASVDGEVTIDVRRDADGNIINNGTMTLGANRILLGDSGAVEGLRVDAGLSGNFTHLAALSLNSYKNVDIYSPLTLGNTGLDLTINAGGIAGHLAGGESAQLTAKTFTLKNSLNATYEPVATAAGTALTVAANEIVLAGGTAQTATTIGGFETVRLDSAAETRFRGTGSTTVDAAHTNLQHARITADTGSDYGLTATGAVSTSVATQADSLPAASGLGGKLKLAGSSVAIDSQIDLPSGQLTVQSTGGDLTLGSSAAVRAASTRVDFGKYSAHTPGGSVTLQSDNANVVLQAGSSVDVSGGTAADAGSLAIMAKSGSITADGALQGAGGSGKRGGSFNSDSATLASIGNLNTALNAGGFNESREVRLRSGNLEIAAGETVTARNVVLSADAGKIDIGGTIDADGVNGGYIGIHARDEVTIKNTAQLLARATGDAIEAGDVSVGAGGEVMLSSLSKASINAISAESGSLIDVSGDQQVSVQGQKGEVTLRAYRGTTGMANTVNVAFGTTAAIKGAESVRIEGARVYNSATFATNTATIVADTNAFYTANPGAGSYAATQDGASIEVLPNIEVRSTGTTTPTDLTIAADLNMRAFGAMQAGKGGTLTLRANKDLKLNGSLSDAFSTATTAGVLQTGKSFGYELVAGSDFNAANRMATTQGGGGLTLANNKLIRTGTGDIRIASGGDITMGNEGAVIYTVGKVADDLAGFTAPETSTLANKNGRTEASYLTRGGDIDIRAQGSIIGKTFASGNQQTVNQWLFRQGGGSQGRDVSWWVRPDLFKQGVAALGGGDVNIQAGGSITNFSASVPTTARYTDDGSGSYRIDGGGNLMVRAGSDIKSGVYYAGRGDVRLDAGGEVAAAPGTFGTAIALQDASAQVSAGKGVFIETVFNPTLWAQSSNVTNALATTGDSSFFSTYGTDTALRLAALNGNVRLGLAASGNIKNATGLNSSTSAAGASLELHPGAVEATAFSGDISLRKLVMAPAVDGNLRLLAANNVSTEGTAYVVMSDADPGLLPSVDRPLAGSGSLGSELVKYRTQHAATPLHQGDAIPVAIVARDGSISMVGSDVGANVSNAGPGLTTAKAAYLQAGKDITLNALVQHVDGGDLSVVDAGRDFLLPSGKKQTRLEVSGPGELLVKAGRNVDLADTTGVLSVGNTSNTALPESGAAITVMAGLGSEGADLGEYIARYIVPVAAGSETSSLLTAFMRQQTGNPGLGEQEAKTQFLALDSDRQTLFINRHLSSELLADGKAYAETGNHVRGDSAIAALFPAGRKYGGDILMYKSQIRTQRNGSIDFVAPGGLINAGVPGDVGSLGHDIGVVTEKGGAIRAFAQDGFLVNQSKVITQYGGDITVWVNQGDIDAGRGSKTAVSVPQRVVSTDVDGFTTVEMKGVAAGSGIRAQTYDPDGPAGPAGAPALGSVALIAPRGVLNAGEAGIAAGNFLAVATQVIGASNISVSGSSSGLATADTASLGGLGNVSNVAADAAKAASDDLGKQLAQNTASVLPKNLLPSFISVEVIGLGE